jgi:hypothetical protein
VTLCRPNSENEKTRLKLTAIGALENDKQGLRPLGHRSVEWQSNLCFQQIVYPRVGSWLKDAGRGTQESGDPVIARDRVIGKPNLISDRNG